MSPFRSIPSLVAIVLATVGSGADEPIVGMLDGAEHRGAVVSAVTEAGEVRLAGRAEPLALDLLRLIETGQAEKRAAAGIEVEFIDGGRTAVNNLGLARERLSLAARWQADPVELPLDGVRRIRFKPENDQEIYRRSFGVEPGDFDQVLLEIEGEVQVVKGFLVTIDDKEIVTSFEGERATFPRDQVYGVVMAKPELVLPSQNAEVHLADGTRLKGNVKRFDGTTLVFVLLDGGEVGLEWNSVVRLHLNADRLVFLSDLEPAEAVKQPLVAPVRDWQRDRSVAGKPLRLDGEPYRKGLGTASGMRLVFEPLSKYDRFSTTIGIDDATGSHGDCEFIVYKDREEILRKRVKGGDKAEKVTLDIRGADTVTLEVDYAGDLDLADHANWAEACFIKDEKK